MTGRREYHQCDAAVLNISGRLLAELLKLIELTGNAAQRDITLTLLTLAKERMHEAIQEHGCDECKANLREYLARKGADAGAGEGAGEAAATASALLPTVPRDGKVN